MSHGSYLFVYVKTRAAVFKTRWSSSVHTFGAPANKQLQQFIRLVMNEWMSAVAESASSDRRTRRSWRKAFTADDWCVLGQTMIVCNRHSEQRASAETFTMSVPRVIVGPLPDNFLMLWLEPVHMRSVWSAFSLRWSADIQRLTSTIRDSNVLVSEVVYIGRIKNVYSSCIAWHIGCVRYAERP